MDHNLAKLYGLFPECDLFPSQQPRLLCQDDGKSNGTALKSSGEITFTSLQVPPFITNFQLEDGSLICGAIFSIIKAWACKFNVA